MPLGKQGLFLGQLYVAELCFKKLPVPLRYPVTTILVLDASIDVYEALSGRKISENPIHRLPASAILLADVFVL